VTPFVIYGSSTALMQGILSPVHLLLTIITLATPIPDAFELSASTLELNEKSETCSGGHLQLKDAQLKAQALELNAKSIQYCHQTSALRSHALQIASPNVRLVTESARGKMGDDGVEWVELGRGYATRCMCHKPLWTINFESAAWHANRSILIDWPTLTVLDVPVLVLPYWTLSASGREQGFGVPKLGWSADRGLRFGLPITWALKSGADWTFEMGRDGTDQYGLTRIAWTDKLDSERALQLELIGPDMNATGLGTFASNPVSLTLEFDWLSSPQKRGLYRRDWREHIRPFWTSSLSVSTELGPIFVGLNTWYGQANPSQLRTQDTWFAQALFGWPHRLADIQHTLGLDISHSGTDVAREALLALYSDAWLSRQYGLLYVNARWRNTLVFRDAFGDRDDAWYGNGHLFPGLTVLGQFRDIKHTVTLGPDLWMNRAATDRQSLLSSTYNQRSLHGVGVRLHQEFQMPSGHAWLSVRRDLVSNQTQIDRLQLQTRIAISNTYLRAEAFGSDWLSADVHQRATKQLNLGVRAVSSETTEFRPRYLRQRLEQELSVPIRFTESRGIGPSLVLDTTSVHLALSGLWGGPQLEWQGYYGKGGWRHSCECLSLELEFNQGRFEKRPNLFVNIRLDSN